MDTSALIHFFIQFGTGLCILSAAAEFVKKTDFNLPLFLMNLGLASVQLRLGFWVSGDLVNISNAQAFTATTFFAVGPLVLLLGRHMLSFTGKSFVPFPYHLIPAALGLVYDVYFLLLPESGRLDELRSLYDGRWTILRSGLLTGFLYTAGYLFYTFLLMQIQSRKFKIGYFGYRIGILIVPLLPILVCIVGLIFENISVVATGGIMLTGIYVLVHLLPFRHPNFFYTIQAEIDRQRYEGTQLTGIDLDHVDKKLMRLFEEDQIHHRDDLRLSHIAEILQISTHQLSRILNERYNQNFNEFVNRHRIAEAQLLLLSSDKSVLDIAYAVGFHTKATFNSQFLKIVGMTPLAFRKDKSGKGRRRRKAGQ